MSDTAQRDTATIERLNRLDYIGNRAGGLPADIDNTLGLLSGFVGSWSGFGFNMIARPDHQNGQPFFLELNPTLETLDISAISGEIPNRGSVENDRFLFGLHYLQKVKDSVANAAIHIEPGLLLRVPPTGTEAQQRAPSANDVYVRQASIPHGDSVMAFSTFFTSVQGGPVINPVSTTPFTGPIPDLNQAPANPIPASNPYLAPFKNATLPNLPQLFGLSATQLLADPTRLLAAAIRDQHIISTDVIQLSTELPANNAAGAKGAIANIPFITRNANSVRLDAIFWIELAQTMRNGQAVGAPFRQLQYVQRVILDFETLPPTNEGIHWPHVSVATLKLV